MFKRPHVPVLAHVDISQNEQVLTELCPSPPPENARATGMRGSFSAFPGTFNRPNLRVSAHISISQNKRVLTDLFRSPPPGTWSKTRNYSGMSGSFSAFIGVFKRPNLRR